jgi:hypothetical protein
MCRSMSNCEPGGWFIGTVRGERCFRGGGIIVRGDCDELCRLVSLAFIASVYDPKRTAVKLGGGFAERRESLSWGVSQGGVALRIGGR